MTLDGGSSSGIHSEVNWFSPVGDDMADEKLWFDEEVESPQVDPEPASKESEEEAKDVAAPSPEWEDCTGKPRVGGYTYKKVSGKLYRKARG